MGNLTVVSHCLTHKVIFENRQAVAVELEKTGKNDGQGRLQRIRANKEIILCAGA